MTSRDTRRESHPMSNGGALLCSLLPSIPRWANPTTPAGERKWPNPDLPPGFACGGWARFYAPLGILTNETCCPHVCLDFLTNENVMTYACLDLLTNENVWTYVARPGFCPAAPPNRLDKKCHFLPVGNFKNTLVLFVRILVNFIRFSLTFHC